MNVALFTLRINICCVSGYSVMPAGYPIGIHFAALLVLTVHGGEFSECDVFLEEELAQMRLEARCEARVFLNSFVEFRGHVENLEKYVLNHLDLCPSTFSSLLG
jgi:hypothetical protein